MMSLNKNELLTITSLIILAAAPLIFTTNKSETLYLSNFTADVVISDKAGKVLGGVQNLPVSEILSHHKNNEISLTVSLTQSNPFPVRRLYGQISHKRRTIGKHFSNSK